MKNAIKSQWGSGLCVCVRGWGRVDRGCEPRIEVLVKMQNKVRGVPGVQFGVLSGEGVG